MDREYLRAFNDEIESILQQQAQKTAQAFAEMQAQIDDLRGQVERLQDNANCQK